MKIFVINKQKKTTKLPKQMIFFEIFLDRIIDKLSHLVRQKFDDVIDINLPAIR